MVNLDMRTDPGCGLWTFDCDGADCNRSTTGDGTLKEACDEAKDKGWTIRKADGEWSHFCPNCSEKQ